MADRDYRRETRWLVGLCVMLGAVVGLIIGVEFLAGLGMSALIIGGLMGSGLGAMFGYCGADAARRGRTAERSLLPLPGAPAAPPIDTVANDNLGIGRHVARLNEERVLARDDSRDR